MIGSKDRHGPTLKLNLPPTTPFVDKVPKGAHALKATKETFSPLEISMFKVDKFHCNQEKEFFFASCGLVFTREW